MFAQKFITPVTRLLIGSLKGTRQVSIRESRRAKRANLVNEQVKEVLATADQKLILMVRS